MIKKIYSKAFNQDINNLDDSFQVSILTGGLKSAVYLIEYNKSKVVLKFSNDNSNLLSLDKDILWWEAEILKYFENKSKFFPHFYYFDSSHELLEESYLFMSYIKGDNYATLKSNFSDKDKKNIEYNIGKIAKEICSVKVQKFFLPTNPFEKFKSNYEFVTFLFNSLFHDAVKNNLDIESLQKKIQKLLIDYQAAFDYNLNICCVPTDLWDGNVIIENKKISGIVDVGDFYFCDELMTFYFHSMDGVLSSDFLNGFGKTGFSNEEIIRMHFYRLYTLLKTAIECKANNYGYYDWLYNDMYAILDKLNKDNNKVL